MEEIMWTWPAVRFEAAFAAYLVRRQRDLLRQHRDRMIVAFYTNSSYDSDKGREERKKMIDTVSDSYDEAVEILYGSRESGTDEDDVVQEMENDPLFGPLMRQIKQEETRIRITNEGAGRALLER